MLPSALRISTSTPAGVTPALGPDATGVGWVFQYALVDRSDAEKRAAMGMFGFSILYLFALFSALLAEQSFGLFRAVIA